MTDFRFRKYKVYADIHGGFCGRGCQMTVGLSTTAIFHNLGGYCFGNVRDKTSNITWRYATPCRPVIDCKMNDLEWSWVTISCQNPLLTCKAVACLPQRLLDFLVTINHHFLWVLFCCYSGDKKDIHPIVTLMWLGGVVVKSHTSDS